MVYLFCAFLLEKVTHAFYYHRFLQEWHVPFESATMYVFLRPWSSIHHIQVPNDEFHRNFHLSTCPCCCQFPVSAETLKDYSEILEDFSEKSIVRKQSTQQQAKEYYSNPNVFIENARIKRRQGNFSMHLFF